MDSQKYTGSCHCGSVRFEVQGDMTNVISCNCSMCSRTGALLAFVPAEQFKLLAGEDVQLDYQFNRHVIHHLFCRNCGIRSFAKGIGPGGAEMRAINVRCLDGIDLDELKIKKVDGRSF
jgi:hypothetical protein